MVRKIKNLFWKIVTAIFYSLRFNHIGNGSVIFKPLILNNTGSIYVGNKVYISPYAWLMGGESNSKTLIISDYTVIGNFSHIVGLNKVCIGKNVLIADKVFITDCNHNFDNINLPIKNQGVKILGEVYIGDDSWIGENVSIIGTKIGKHCVIGANSVVVNDIPDFSVAVGVPAKVIKKYNFDNNKWEKVI